MSSNHDQYVDNNSESASSRAADAVGSNSSLSSEAMDQNGITDRSGNSQPAAPPPPPQTPDSSANHFENSEFESNDKQEHFELWSSDATSPDDDENIPENNQVSTGNIKAKQGWNEPIDVNKITSLQFTGTAGLLGLDLNRKYSALECFKLFVDDDLINLMVTETNKYARSKFIKYGYHEGFLSGWLDVDIKEMTQFIGLMIFMAFKRLPETSSYWSTDRIYFNSVACRVFTQTRFHRILPFWNFGNDGTDSVYSKVNPLISRLNTNFRKYKEPGNILYVGKNTVHLRNKYIFETQRAGTAKKGSKILKVMDQDVYTYKLKVHPPENGPTRIHQMKDNVLELLDGFLDQGRLVIFHNLYISLELAQELLKRKCHAIGMIRKNARGTPRELEGRTMQDGELIGYQNAQGISVMKWQLLGAPYYGITTCHGLDTVSVQKKVRNHGENSTTIVEEKVPHYLRDISLSEKVFDAYDKYSINTSPFNDQVKWYQRLASDAIVNAATTNALVLYKKLNKEKMKMWDFRDRLFRELVDVKQLPNISSDEETEEPELED